MTSPEVAEIARLRGEYLAKVKEFQIRATKVEPPSTRERDMQTQFKAGVPSHEGICVVTFVTNDLPRGVSVTETPVPGTTPGNAPTCVVVFMCRCRVVLHVSFVYP